jgi:hypothetical protein
MFRRTCKIIFRYFLNEVAIEAIQTKIVWRSSVLFLKYHCQLSRVCYLTTLSFVKIMSSLVLECVSLQHYWNEDPKRENQSIRWKICLSVTFLSPTWTGLCTNRHYQPNTGPTSKQPRPSHFSS